MSTLLTNLISYWKLDETSGNAIDAHGANTLTDHNTVTSAAGKVGTARQFTVANQESFSIADNADLSTGDIDFTIQAWVYFDSLGQYRIIVSKDDYAINSREYNLYYDISSGYLAFFVTSDGTAGTLVAVLASNFGAPPLGVWLLVHGWHDSVNNIIGISVNAGTPNTTSDTAGVFSGTSRFGIGSYFATGSPELWFSGRIDEVGFWKRVLTPIERAALYNYGHGLQYELLGHTLTDSLIAYWPLTELSGNAIDVAGVNNLTSHGSPGYAPGKFTTARSFNASTNYFDRADNADLSVGDIDFTVQGWVYLNSLGNYQVVLGKDDFPGGREYIVYYDIAFSRFVFLVHDGGSQGFITADTLGVPSINTWYYIVAWHNATANTINIQINNGTADSTSWTTGVVNGTTAFAIGADFGSGSPGNLMNGRIGGAALWKRLLTTQERTDLYAGGSGLDFPFVSPRVYRRALTIDHTKVPSTLTNFPVLVSLTDSQLASIANGGHVYSPSGHDIRFFADAGLTQQLKWDIEKYVSSTGQIIVNVKVPTISSSVDTLFYVAYGDPRITTYQGDAANAWDSDYLCIYHLGDTAGLSLVDSKNARNLTNHGTAITATGQVDGAVQFNGSSQWLSGPNSGDGEFTNQLTAEAWARATAFNGVGNASLFRNEAGFGVKGFILGFAGSKIVVARGSGGAAVTTGATTLSTDTWYYLVNRYDGATLKAFVNGVEDGSNVATGSITTTGFDISMGAYDPTSGVGEYFNGRIDEVRLSKVARSADWITACYNNQSSPSTFVSLGSETLNNISLYKSPQFDGISTGGVLLGGIQG